MSRNRLQRKAFPTGVPGTERSPLLIKTVDVRVDLDVGSPVEVQITTLRPAVSASWQTRAYISKSSTLPAVQEPP